MRKREVSLNWLYVVVALAVVVALSWVQFSIRSLGNDLEQARSDNAALAAQVRSLGGKPVAEGKPGAQGAQGPQGPQGPPGIQGSPGPTGLNGQSPQCLFLPSRCVGPKGATGSQGEQGTQGPKGDTGVAGETGPQGPPGVDGKDGTDGKDGANGVDGKDGRGIASVSCQADGTWLFTYTDNTTQTVDGPCRTVPPIGTGN